MEQQGQDMRAVIGRNAQQRREQIGMSVEDFGRQMEAILGKPWVRQTVSAMENGGRAMAANDVVAIAEVLRTTVADLFTPPADMPHVAVGSLSINRDDFQAKDRLGVVLTGQSKLRDFEEAQRELAAAVRKVARRMTADPDMEAYILDGLQAERRYHQEDEPLPPDVNPDNPSGLRSDLDKTLLDFLELVETEYRRRKETDHG